MDLVFCSQIDIVCAAIQFQGLAMPVLTVDNCGGVPQHNVGAAIRLVYDRLLQFVHGERQQRCFSADRALSKPLS